jgi:hypothetical protein
MCGYQRDVAFKKIIEAGFELSSFKMHCCRAYVMYNWLRRYGLH